MRRTAILRTRRRRTNSRALNIVDPASLGELHSFITHTQSFEAAPPWRRGFAFLPHRLDLSLVLSVAHLYFLVIMGLHLNF